MRTRAQVVKRVALGLALLVLAAALSFIIKDALAVRQPENSLPEITVYYNGTPLPSVNYGRDSYSWRFITGAAVGSISDAEWRSIEFAPVVPEAPMELRFSYEPRDVTVSIAQGTGPFTEEDFLLLEEYEENEDGTAPGPDRYILYGNRRLYTPYLPGTYVLRIWADWGWRGSVLYYVKLDVVR